MPASGAAVAPQLAEIAKRIDDLAAGDVDALNHIRPALHRVVVAPHFSGAVKAALVHALLLLDDPRVVEGQSGTALLQKVRKLVSSALAVDIEHAGQSSAASRAEFSPDALLSSDMDRPLIDEFIAEAREQLEVGEAALLVLDNDTSDLQALETLFRALHSIKGTSAFFGMEPATELAHHAETLLTRVRSGAATCSGELSNLIFRSIDMLDAMLFAIERAVDGETAMVPQGYRELITALREGPAPEIEPSVSRRGSSQFRRLMSSDLNVRIRAGELDRLADIVRELVLAHSMVARDPGLRSHPELSRKLAFAERLAFEVEDLSNELRTVAFATTLQKLARLARDAAYQSGKSIDIVMEGDDVLVERVASDALADPLMHMVRNAIDHGFESAEERVKAGKPAVGRLRVCARKHGSQLVIELSDDGRGIDPNVVAQVAKKRGWIDEDAELSERELFDLLFRPGFSTASVVTDLSGRGVGMDVVRTNVDAIGGTIEITSRLGAGTTFTIRLPFRSQQARTAQPTWMDSQRSIGLSA